MFSGCCISPHWKGCGLSDQELDYWSVDVKRSNGNIEHHLESALALPLATQERVRLLTDYLTKLGPDYEFFLRDKKTKSPGDGYKYTGLNWFGFRIYARKIKIDA